MYRRPRFLEELHAAREEMARECDYDVDLFAEMIRRGMPPTDGPLKVIRGRRLAVPPRKWSEETDSQPKSRKATGLDDEKKISNS